MSNLVILLLGIESLIMVSLIVLYDNSANSSNLYYLSTLAFLICWAIYFSWHSMVKENSFELTAFMSMIIIVSTEGIFFVLTHSMPPLVQYLGIGYFIASFLLYLICCYSCYMHFGQTAINELENSRHYSMLAAIKDYEMFISVIKLNFVLFSVITTTFLYYVLEEWSGQMLYVGIALFVAMFAASVGHSVGGIFCATSEKYAGMVAFIAMVPLLQIAQAGMVFEVAKGTGSVNFIILDQAYALFVVSLLINTGNMYLGVKNYKCFGSGRKSIIEKTNDDLVKAAFL